VIPIHKSHRSTAIQTNAGLEFAIGEIAIDKAFLSASPQDAILIAISRGGDIEIADDFRSRRRQRAGYRGKGHPR